MSSDLQFAVTLSLKNSVQNSLVPSMYELKTVICIGTNEMHVKTTSPTETVHPSPQGVEFRSNDLAKAMNPNRLVRDKVRVCQQPGCQIWLSCRKCLVSPCLDSVQRYTGMIGVDRLDRLELPLTDFPYRVDFPMP